MFSDNSRTPSTYTVSTRDWGRFSSTGNRNEVTLTLLDQYGDAHSGTAALKYRFSVTTGEGDDAVTVNGNVVSNGRARIVYTNPAAIRAEQAVNTVIAVQSSTDGFQSTADVTAAAEPPALTIYWAEPGSAASHDNAVVHVVDPAARSIVVERDEDDSDTTDDPEYYVFGTDDTFVVDQDASDASEGTSVSFAQFMEVLIAANNPTIKSIGIFEATTLTWEGYNPARPRDRAKWILRAVCRPEPNGG